MRSHFFLCLVALVVFSSVLPLVAEQPLTVIISDTSATNAAGLKAWLVEQSSGCDVTIVTNAMHGDVVAQYLARPAVSNRTFTAVVFDSATGAGQPLLVCQDRGMAFVDLRYLQTKDLNSARVRRQCLRGFGFAVGLQVVLGIKCCSNRATDLACLDKISENFSPPQNTNFEAMTAIEDVKRQPQAGQ